MASNYEYGEMQCYYRERESTDFCIEGRPLRFLWQKKELLHWYVGSSDRKCLRSDRMKCDTAFDFWIDS